MIVHVTDGDSYCCTSALHDIIYLIVPTGVCPPLQNPINGRIFMVGNTAGFVCFNGTTAVGNPVLTCSSGNWDYPPPTCRFQNP